MTAAAIIAHWSRYSGPIGSPGRKMARKIARNWTLAFAFPQIDGSDEVAGRRRPLP